MADLSVGADDLLHTVGASMGLIVMVWELEQQTIVASEQWSTLVGGPTGAQCFAASQLQTFIHPDDIAELQQAIVRCLKGQQTFYDVEIRVRSEAGHWHWLSGRGRVAARNAAQRATRMVATFIEAGSRRLAEQALADSEARYRAMFDVSMQAILLTTPQGQILSANPAACDLLGYTEAELRQLAPTDLGVLAGDQFAGQLQSCIDERQSHGEASLIRRDGAAIEVESSLALFTERSGALRISIELHDVSHARQIERRLHRLTKLYDARSRCSRAVIDCQTREDLFRAVCQIVVDCGDFGLVWIALADSKSLAVGGAFASGAQLDYLKNARVSLDPKDILGRGPLASAIRERRAIITNDFLNDPSVAPWHALAERHHFRSSAVFPIMQIDETIGALILYAPEKDYFDAPLISLLAQITDDVSFGVGNLRRQIELQSSEARFRTLWETSTDAIVIMTEHSIIRFVNPAMENLLGYTCAELIGKHVEMIQPARYRHRHMQGMGAFLRTGQRMLDWRASQGSGLHRDGHEVPLEIAFSQADIGGENLFIGFMRDVTERKRAIDLTANQNRILKMISSGADLPQTIAEISRLVEEHVRCLVCAIQVLSDATALPAKGRPGWSANPHNATKFGTSSSPFAADADDCLVYTIDELKNNPALSYLHAIAPNYDADLCRLWPVIGRQRQLVAYLAIFYQNSGAVTDAEKNLIPIACELAGLAIENKNSDDRIRYLAHSDELTGLSNRAHFLQMLSQAIARASRWGTKVGLLFVDLDRFKNINDSHGHEAGDKVLREVAERLRGAIREVDMIARLGGDEFVILAEEVGEPSVLGGLAQKLIEKISLPFNVDEDHLHLTASVGISTYPADGKDLYELIKNADTAMYRVKELGRNGHQFYAEQMSADSRERILLEAGLRRAVEHNELVLHYQPKLDLVTGAVTGVEALVRWQHPDLGLLGPLKFIPLAEETGLIVAIGQWVLHAACRQLSQWIARGMAPMHMAVNLSARQFRNSTLLQDIQQALQRADLPPHLLELEVTESLVMDNPEHAVQLLGRFKEQGISLAMDDFGTGYSSLANLKSFPFDCVKVDRSFVRDVVIDPHDAAITRAIIAMAHVLHLRVIAEGVETAEQLEFLREHGCDEIQGYHFAKPMPAQLAEEFLLARQKATQKGSTV